MGESVHMPKVMSLICFPVKARIGTRRGASRFANWGRWARFKERKAKHVRGNCLCSGIKGFLWKMLCESRVNVGSCSFKFESCYGYDYNLHCSCI